MKRSSAEIYGLAVCFVTLLCFVIALGIGIYDLLQITSLEFTLNANEYERHQSNESYGRAPRRVFLANLGLTKAVPIEEPSEEEITRRRKESYRSLLRAERRPAGRKTP